MKSFEAHSRHNGRLIGLTISLATMTIAAVIFFVPRFFPGIFLAFAKPFWQAEFRIESGGLKSVGQLLSENESLKRQVEESNLRLDSVKSIEDENLALQALMGRASTTPGILAAVLERPPYVPYDELIIDIGLDQGLSTTSKVYVAGDILIGRVAEVYQAISKVILYSSPGQKLEVQIGSDHVPATAIGRGGGQYVAELPRGTAIAEGDYVNTLSLKDRSFGTVSRILPDPAGQFEQVLFALPVNIYQLRWVMVAR